MCRFACHTRELEEGYTAPPGKASESRKPAPFGLSCVPFPFVAYLLGMNMPPSCWRPLESCDADFLRDESRRTGRAAHIAFPDGEDGLAAVLAHARAHAIPLTVQGARTGITGGAVPDGGAILNLSRMARIAPAPPDPVTGAPRLSAEPGATLAAIRDACPPGWFFAPDPTEPSASIGGMFACNASGALSYLYGPVRPSVAAARILLEDGTLLDLERGRDRLRGLRLDLPGGRSLDFPALPPRPAVKNAAGYFLEPDMDALDLFIGAEGTLGILAGATLVLRPAPAVRWALLAFPGDTPAEAAAAPSAPTPRPPASPPSNISTPAPSRSSVPAPTIPSPAPPRPPAPPSTPNSTPPPPTPPKPPSCSPPTPSKPPGPTPTGPSSPTPPLPSPASRPSATPSPNPSTP